MVEPMVKEGRVQKGTPLARLVDALGSDAEAVTVLAGDGADVCRACDDADHIVSALFKDAKGYPGAQVSVAAADVRHLVNLLAEPEVENDEPVPVKAKTLPAKRGTRKKPPVEEAPSEVNDDFAGE